MKLFFVLLMINLFFPNYYTVDTVADPYVTDCDKGTLFTVNYEGDLQVFEDSDLYNGRVTLVLYNSGTPDDVTDDTIYAVIER